MASVRARKRAGGTSYAVLFTHDGKQRSVTFTDQRQARQLAAQITAVGPTLALAALRGGLDATPDTPTVREAMARMIDGLTGITDGTRADYHAHARRDILPALGHLPVTSLTRDSVAGWVNALERKGLSAKTIKNRHSLLSQLCARLVEDGQLKSNAARGMRLPRDAGRQMTFLTRAEFVTLLDCTPAYWRPLVVFLAGTGARFGETAALEVGDVDLDAHPVSVRIWQAVKHNRARREVGPPKSRAGTRTLYLPRPHPVVEALDERCADASGLVFTAPRGGPIRQATFHADIWAPTLRRAAERGLTKRPRVHDLRHTCATWMLSAGVPVLTVAEWLGHEDVTQTMNRYGHAVPADRGLAAMATAVALSQAVPEVLEIET